MTIHTDSSEEGTSDDTSMVAMGAGLARPGRTPRHADLLRLQRPAGAGLGRRRAARNLARPADRGDPIPPDPAPAVRAADSGRRVAHLVRGAECRRELARL